MDINPQSAAALTASFSSDPSSSGQTANASRKAIETRAQEFEALMLSEFLKPMFDTAKSSSLFGGDSSENSIFGGMLHETYGRAIAERGGIGIADQVKAALINLQSDHQSVKGTPS